jgi:hypothetical protein
MTTTTRSRRAAPLAVLACMAFAGDRARADEDYISPTNERVRVSLGVMHVSNSTTVRADSSTGVTGTVIDGEQQFGLDTADFEPKFQAVVRVAERHRITFDYFTLDRNGSATVTSPILFRDVTFLPGDPLQTNLSLRSFGIGYEYSFWHSETLEIAGVLGIHDTDVSALAKVETAARHVTQSDDQAGPIPTLGIDGTWVISKRFYVNLRGQYMTAHIDNIDGSLGFYDFDFLYRYRANVSFAVGYTEIVAHIDSEHGSQTGIFDFNSKGPEMFFRIAF